MSEIRLDELSTYLTSCGMANELVGDASLAVRAVNTLEDAGKGEVSFLANPKYKDRLALTKASAVLVDRTVDIPAGRSAIRSDDPYAALCASIIKIHGHRKHPKWGGNDRAHIDPSAQIGGDANVGPDVSIGRDVKIGKNATIYPGCYIADRVRIGDDVTLYPNVVIYDDCVLGHRVTIHACSVIGEDGLGYAPVGDQWIKIPQVGRTVIEDDVEIGACCTIDRATLGATCIGAGTKTSNLIAVGHGTKVGPNCMIVAQVGIAGSTTIGRHVTLAGQAGIVGHLQIGDNASIGAQSGVTSNVDAGTTMLGSPAVPIADAKRQMMTIQKLPEMRRRIKDLEAAVEELRLQIEHLGPLSS